MEPPPHPSDPPLPNPPSQAQHHHRRPSQLKQQPRRVPVPSYATRVLNLPLPPPPPLPASPRERDLLNIIQPGELPADNMDNGGWGTGDTLTLPGVAGENVDKDGGWGPAPTKTSRTAGWVVETSLSSVPPTSTLPNDPSPPSTARATSGGTPQPSRPQREVTQHEITVAEEVTPNQSNLPSKPTYARKVRESPRHAFEEPNREELRTPRVWGQKSTEGSPIKPIVSLPSGIAEKDGSEDRLKKWKSQLEVPGSPSIVIPPPDIEPQPVEEEEDFEPDREGSDYEPPPPVVAYYSDDEKSQSSSPPSPEINPTLETEDPSSVTNPIRDHDTTTHTSKTKPPTVIEVNVPPLLDSVIRQARNLNKSPTKKESLRQYLEKTTLTPTISISSLPATSNPIDDGAGVGGVSNYNTQRGRRSKPGDPGKWWRRDPHPVYSARFASQRLLVEFPCPIRRDLVVQTMMDHFSRYGTVRTVMPYEVNGNQCEKAYVVFWETESVHKYFSDPARYKCHFRSSSYVTATTLQLTIKTVEPQDTYRTIWIGLTGPRADSRSRLASPKPHSHQTLLTASKPTKDIETTNHVTGTEAEGETDKRKTEIRLSPLPDKVIVDAVPQRNRFDKIVYWARLRPHDQRAIEKRNNGVWRDTGEEVVEIGQVDLRRRVPEKEIIPKLCDFFGDIADIFPPTEVGQGWQVCVDGPLNARHMMDQLQQIPGFTVRWAHQGDGWHPIDRQSIPDDDNHSLMSPMTRLNRDLEGYPSLPRRRVAPGQSEIDKEGGEGDSSWTKVDVAEEDNGGVDLEDGVSKLAISPSNSTKTVLPAVPPTPKLQNTTTGLPSAVHTLPNILPSLAHLEPDPRYPLLRRTLLHTYRGRLLKEEITENGEVRYIDERAIFIGRLVKEKENTRTIFGRFQKYGIICSIEYNPNAAQTTYATARVLFQDQESVAKAIQFEDEAVSEGSAIKVEVRRVLPLDVQTREMYIDPYGRAVSPSMASQYSPPSNKHFSPNTSTPMIPPQLPPIRTDYQVPPPLNAMNHVQPPWMQLPLHPLPPVGSIGGMPVQQMFGQGMLPHMFEPVYGYGHQIPANQITQGQTPQTPPPDTLGHPQLVGSMHQQVYPQVLFAMGIGYQPQPLPPPTPQLTYPPTMPLPQQPHPVSSGMTPVPVYPTLAPMNPIPSTTSPIPPKNPSTPPNSAQPKVETGLQTPNLQVPSPSHLDGIKKSPTVLMTKFEDGVLKVVYDPEELKRYKEENGIEDTVSLEVAKKEDKLLPLSTGGHDITYQYPTLAFHNHQLQDQQSQYLQQIQNPLNPTSTTASPMNHRPSDHLLSPRMADGYQGRFSVDPSGSGGGMSLGDQIELENQRLKDPGEAQRRASIGPGTSPQHPSSIALRQDNNRVTPLPVPLLSPPLSGGLVGQQQQQQEAYLRSPLTPAARKFPSTSPGHPHDQVKQSPGSHYSNLSHPSHGVGSSHSHSHGHGHSQGHGDRDGHRGHRKRGAHMSGSRERGHWGSGDVRFTQGGNNHGPGIEIGSPGATASGWGVGMGIGSRGGRGQDGERGDGRRMSEVTFRSGRE